MGGYDYLGIKRAIFLYGYCASSYVFHSITPVVPGRITRPVGATRWVRVVNISVWTNFLSFAQKLCHDVTMA
jgi:hypothetical protein